MKTTMSKESKELVSQLKTMNENIAAMNKLISINIGKKNIFIENAEMGDIIKTLDVYDIPDKYIAILLGTTPESVASLRHQRKKAEKIKVPKPEPDKTNTVEKV
jgi:hypothetical protein